MMFDAITGLGAHVRAHAQPWTVAVSGTVWTTSSVAVGVWLAHPLPAVAVAVVGASMAVAGAVVGHQVGGAEQQRMRLQAEYDRDWARHAYERAEQQRLVSKQMAKDAEADHIALAAAVRAAHDEFAELGATVPRVVMDRLAAIAGNRGSEVSR